MSKYHLFVSTHKVGDDETLHGQYIASFNTPLEAYRRVTINYEVQDLISPPEHVQLAIANETGGLSIFGILSGHYTGGGDAPYILTNGWEKNSKMVYICEKCYINRTEVTKTVHTWKRVE